VLLGGWLGYVISGFNLSDYLFCLLLWRFFIFWFYVVYAIFFYLWGFFGPLGFGYRSMRVFDSGWMKYFGGQGLYWVLFSLGRVNQWAQNSSLRVFLGFFIMWDVILLFLLAFYLNSLLFTARR
jgi:hypothetical protein